MADRFVDLQPQLRAVQDQIEDAFGTLRRRMQRDGLLGHARRVLEQLQLVDQLVALELILPSEGVRVGALLNLVVPETVGGKNRRRWSCASDRCGCPPKRRTPAARA